MKRFESNGKTSSYIFTDHKAKVMFSQACVHKGEVYPSMHSVGVCMAACTWTGGAFEYALEQGGVDKVVFRQDSWRGILPNPPPHDSY